MSLISNQVNIWKEITDGGGGLVCNDNLDGVIGMLKKWLLLVDAHKRKMEINAESIYKNQFTVEKAAKNIFDVFTQ